MYSLVQFLNGLRNRRHPRTYGTVKDRSAQSQKYAMRYLLRKLKRFTLWVKQPGQLSLPSIRGRWIHVLSLIAGVETTKRQTRAAYGCFVGQSLWGCLSWRPIGCTSDLYVTKKAPLLLQLRFEALYERTGWPKKLAHFVCLITSSNVDEFSNCFHYH